MPIRAVVGVQIAAALGAFVASNRAMYAPDTWFGSVSFTNQVAGAPTFGGGYPIPPGSRVPLAGTCRPGPVNTNHSEDWLVDNPGLEDLGGRVNFVIGQFTPVHLFYFWGHTIHGGAPSQHNRDQQ